MSTDMERRELLCVAARDELTLKDEKARAELCDRTVATITSDENFMIEKA